MAKYCITAANHSNKDNHCASEFEVFQQSSLTGKWRSLGGKAVSFISELLENGHTVVSGRLIDKAAGTVSLGAPIELELRIAKNETKYKISDMPPF